MSFAPLMRWSGGKRKQAEDIVNRFPNDIDTLWIPFLGGGSVLYQSVNSGIRYKHIVASDIYAPLMGIWYILQKDPQTLYESYEYNYNKFIGHEEEYYNEIVAKFNKTHDLRNATDFFFIVRTCFRGQIEFDANGNFCTRYVDSKGCGGARPETLRPIIYRWSEAVRDVEFVTGSYTHIVPQSDNDYCFFDPPYFDSTWYNDHNMDWDAFWSFLRNLPCDYSITLNGNKEMYPIPQDLYTLHEYIYYGINDTKNGMSSSRDSLWQKRTNPDKYDKNKAICGIIKPAPLSMPRRPSVTMRGAGGVYTQHTDFKVLAELQNEMGIINQKLDMVIDILGKFGLDRS